MAISLTAKPESAKRPAATSVKRVGHRHDPIARLIEPNDSERSEQRDGAAHHQLAVQHPRWLTATSARLDRRRDLRDARTGTGRK